MWKQARNMVRMKYSLKWMWGCLWFKMNPNQTLSKIPKLHHYIEIKWSLAHHEGLEKWCHISKISYVGKVMYIWKVKTQIWDKIPNCWYIHLEKQVKFHQRAWHDIDKFSTKDIKWCICIFHFMLHWLDTRLTHC
jgi:hypothetical protein